MQYEFIDDIPKEYMPIIIRLRERGIIPISEKLEHALSEESLYLLKLIARIGML